VILWQRLFGRTSSAVRENAWDGVKREARENERRGRRALEQGPRASAEEMAARVANLRSIDQVHKAYNEMRRADFCDAVTAAVRAGNFSDHDATHALYAREWVSGGGAWRTSFPEWIAEEGRRHFLRLNDEWLKSGEKYTPFNDWLVGIKKSKPEPPAPKPTETTAQEAEVRTWGRDWKRIEPPVQNGKWRLERGGLVCNHELPDLLRSQGAADLRIECAVSRWDNGVVAIYLSFHLTPYLDLLPDQEPFEPHLVKAPFVLGLVADGSGLGTEASPLLQGGMFEINASANEDKPNTAVFSIISTKDTMLAARTVALGSDLTFTLVEHDIIPASVRLHLRLPGDRGFASLYQRLQKSV
jgi:hypothetical protein